MRVLIFVALFVFASAVTIQKNAHYTALQGASFGSLMAEIQAKIKAGGNLDLVFTLLDNLDTQINKEAAEHKAMLTRNRKSCTKEQAFRKEEVKQAQLAFKAASSHLETCAASLKKCKTDLDYTTETLKSERANLRRAEKIRAEEVIVFKKRAAEHQQAKIALESTIEIMNELSSNEQSFMQLSQHSKHMLKTGIKIGLVAKYVPVVSAFAQMATSSQKKGIMSRTQIQQIKQLLDELQTNVRESYNSLVSEEKANQAEFEIEAKGLRESINELYKNKISTNKQIGEMQDCVMAESNIVQKAAAKRERNAGLLEASTRMCTAFETEFKNAEKSRAEERELVREIRTMCKARLDRFDGTSVDVHQGKIQAGKYSTGKHTIGGGNRADQRSEW